MTRNFKHTIIFVLLFFLCFSAFSGVLSGEVVSEYFSAARSGYYREEWRNGFFLDDFGDETQAYYAYYLGEGVCISPQTNDSYNFSYVLTLDLEDGISIYIARNYWHNYLFDSSDDIQIEWKSKNTNIKEKGYYDGKRLYLENDESYDIFLSSLKEAGGLSMLVRLNDGRKDYVLRFGSIKNLNINNCIKKWQGSNKIVYHTNYGNDATAVTYAATNSYIYLKDESTFNRIGASLTGWSTSKDGDSTIIPCGSKVKITRSTSLYAQWNLKTVNYGNFNGKPLVWYVLFEEDEKVYLLSRDCVVMRSVSFDELPAYFSETDLYKWLNGTFLEKSFSGEEYEMQNAIKVTILNENQIEKYLSRKYMKSQFETNDVSWWTRTAGTYRNMLSVVKSDGNLSMTGEQVTSTNIGVRPVLILTKDDYLTYFSE